MYVLTVFVFETIIIYTIMNKRIHFLCSVIAVCCLLLIATEATRAQSPSGLDTVIFVTTDSSWTVPAGVTSVTFECWGAGGGGGSAYYKHSEGGAAGGGGGAYAKKTFSVSEGTVYTFVIGKGGYRNSLTSFGNGGSTKVAYGPDTIVKAEGGKTATHYYSNDINAYLYEAKGGQASNCIGDVTYSGGNGGRGNRFYSSCALAVRGCWSGGGGAAAGPLGNGQTAYRGNSCLNTPYAGQATFPSGSGGAPLFFPSSHPTENGKDGVNYGGGGSGGHSNNTTTALGGKGGPGLVRITYQKSDPCASVSPGEISLGNWRCSGIPASSFEITLSNQTSATPAGGSYSWQKFNETIHSWATLIGETGEQLNVGSKGVYRRGYTVAGCPTVYTSSLNITSHPTDEPAGTVSGPSLTAHCVGETLASLSLTASTSRTEQIQWQKGTFVSGVWQWNDRNTGNAFVDYNVVVQPENNPQYRFYITLTGNECKIYSENTYTITPKKIPAATLTTEPLCSGKLKATATVTNIAEVGGSATYNWSFVKTAGDFTHTAADNTLTVDKILQCPVTATITAKVTGANGCMAEFGPETFNMSLEAPYSSYYNNNGNKDSLMVYKNASGQYIYNENDVKTLVLNHFNAEGNYCESLKAVTFYVSGCLKDGDELTEDYTVSVKVYSDECSPASISTQVIQVFLQRSCATATFDNVSETLCSPQAPLSKSFTPTTPASVDLKYIWTVLSADAGITGANANSTPVASFSETNLSNNGLASATVVYEITPLEYPTGGAPCYGTPFTYSVTLKPSIANAGALTYDDADVVVNLYYGACDTLLNILVPEVSTAITEYANSLVITNNVSPDNEGALLGRLVPGTNVITWKVTDPCGNFVTFDKKYIINYPVCGSGLTATDVDGNVYETVRIGCECWTKSNLKSTKYSNGAEVPFAMGYTSNDYPNADANIANFGRLYTWYSAVNVPEGDNAAAPVTTTDPVSGIIYVQGVCPEGWALPSTHNMRSMTDFATGMDALKSTDESKWLPGKTGTDALGFSAVAAGYYDTFTGKFMDLLGEVFFWSHDVHTATEASCLTIAHYCEQALYQDKSKGMGYSVRCVRRANQ